MRTALLVTAVLLSFPALSVVEAAHIGPCTHEWFEIAFFVAGGGDLYTAGQYTQNCVHWSTYWACRAVRCEAIASIDVTLP